MNKNIYGLNLYQQVSKEGKETDANLKSVSGEIRNRSGLVKSPEFERLNKKIDILMDENKIDIVKKNIKSQKKAEDSGKAPFVTGLIYPQEEELIKVPKKKGEKESIYTRVAKFLMLVGQDEAAKILPHLQQDQIEKIVPEIAKTQHIDTEEAEDILAEFQSLVIRSRDEGGIETAKNILVKAYGEKQGNVILQKSVKGIHKRPFEYFDDADPEKIKLVLSSEAPQTQALVLSQLDPKKAAAVINLMEKEQKTQVVLRLAKMQSVSPEILEAIDKSLYKKLMSLNSENTMNLDGQEILAQILRRMDPESEQRIIGTINDDDPVLGSALREKLWTTEDFLDCDDRYLQKKLQDMSDIELAMIINGQQQPFRDKILSNVSTNRSRIIMDEEKINKPFRNQDCQNLRSVFFASLRRAWEAGELYIKNRDDGETYV